MWGSFFGLGGGNLEQNAAIAHGLRMGCGEERAGGALPADCAPARCVTCQKCYVVGNDPCVVPVWGKDTCCLQRNPTHECRDPARRRPFGVRRNAVGVCSEMTRRVCRSVRYNRSVARLLKRNKIVPLTQKSPHGVILSGAAQISKIKR